MALKFKLRDPKANNTSIQVYFYIDKKRKKYGTGIVIPSELWNDRDGRIKTDKRLLSRIYPKELSPSTIHNDDNNKLQSAEKKVNDYIYDLKGDAGAWSEIVSVLDSVFKNSKFIDDTKQKDSIADFTAKWIDEVKSNGYEYIEKQYARSTIQTYSEFVTSLRKYEKKKRKNLYFDDVNKDVYRDINQYLKKLGLNINSTGKFFKQLRSIMNIAYDDGIHSNLFQRSRSFVVRKEESKNIYLTHKELLTLRYFDDLTSTQKLYRDLFLIGCSTMQRYSDYSRITESDIITRNNIKYWILEQRKGMESMEIELSKPCIELLEKYDFDIISKFNKGKPSSQTLNEYIKIIARKAGITETIIRTKKENGKKETLRTQKCDHITSHSARRTGATLAYLDGMPLIDICAITGHRSITSLEVYIKPTDKDRKERAERMKRIQLDNNVIPIRKAI